MRAPPRSLVLPVAGVALLFAVWQGFATVVDKPILPGPVRTVRAMVADGSVDILTAAGQTAWKAFLALLLAVLIGVPAGVALGVSDTAYQLFRPLLMVIQAVPVVSWLSLVILAWGIGWKGPVFLTFLAVLPIAVLTTVSGVHGLDRNLLEMARLYRVPRRRVLREIYLGSLIPFAVAILNMSVGNAWKAILVTEYLCGGDGLGARILTARMNIDFTRVWSLTLIAVLLGLATEHLVRRGLGKVTSAWVAA